CIDVWNGLATPLRLPGGEVLVRRIVVGKGRVIDLVKVGQPRLPVVGVARIRDLLGGATSLRDRERSAADGHRVALCDRVLDLGPYMLRHDWLLVSEIIKGRNRGRLEGHRNLVGPLLG